MNSVVKKWRESAFNLYINDFITDKEYDKILKRIEKYVQKVGIH